MATVKGVPKLPVTGASERILAVRVNSLIDRGNHEDTETIIGTWYDGNPVYRNVVSLGAMPVASSASVAHSISNLKTVTLLRGVADNGTTQFQYPRINTAGQTSDIRADNTNIIVDTDWTASSYSSLAVIEYTKTTD
jgi:hypothetical protein